MLEKWKVSIAIGENIGAILIELSKALERIKHVDANGFRCEALSLVDNWTI